MNAELQDYIGRVKRHDYNDGTGEMAFGLMALGFTLLGSLQAILPKDSMWRHGFASILLWYAVFLLMFGLIYCVPKAIKKRITWPRTGYVAYRVGGKSWWTAMVAVAFFSVFVAFGLACLMRFDRRHNWMSLAWMGNVAIYVAGYAFWIYRMGKAHPWKWLVLLFMALGLLAIALIAPEDFVGLGRPMLLFVGLTWLGSGGATLYSYIRHTQPPAPEAE